MRLARGSSRPGIAGNHHELGRGGDGFSQGPQRERGPAHTLTSHFQPPEPGENAFPLL